MHDLKAAVGIVANNNLFAGQSLRKGAGVEDEQHFVVAQCQGLRERSELFAAHRAVQVLMLREGTVHVLRVARLLPEADIEVSSELGRVSVRRLDRADVAPVALPNGCYRSK